MRDGTGTTARWPLARTTARTRSMARASCWETSPSACAPSDGNSALPSTALFLRLVVQDWTRFAAETDSARATERAHAPTDGKAPIVRLLFALVCIPEWR